MLTYIVGIYIINLKKTWEKLLFAARAIAAIENPADVCVISARPYGQRAVLKFASHTGATPIAGRFTPGTFTNQIQVWYFALHVHRFALFSSWIVSGLHFQLNVVGAQTSTKNGATTWWTWQSLSLSLISIGILSYLCVVLDMNIEHWTDRLKTLSEVATRHGCLSVCCDWCQLINFIYSLLQGWKKSWFKKSKKSDFVDLNRIFWFFLNFFLHFSVYIML